MVFKIQKKGRSGACAPGRFRATLVAIDADGKRSAPKRLNFRVARR